MVIEDKSKLKIKVIEPKIKEIKAEKKKEEVSELEEEVSDDSFVASMPSGNLMPILPVNLQGQELDNSIDVPTSRNTESSTTPQRSAYTSHIESHRESETKYNLNSAGSQRTQSAMVLQRNNDVQSSRMRFDNPDLLALRGSQQGGDNYEHRIETSDVNVKRRGEWER